MKRWTVLLLSLPLLLKAEEVKIEKEFADSSYSYEKKGEDIRRGSNSPCREINPSAWGCPGNEGVSIRTEFLYWRASEDDLTYAFVSESPVNPTGGFTSNANIRNSRGKLVQMKTNWEPAFRVGAGWNTNYDGWDVQTIYTWYKNSSRDEVASTVSGATGGVTASWTVQSFSEGPAGTSARAFWKFRMDEGSLELGRAFYTSRSFSMRPFLGAKIDRLDRKTRFEYLGSISQSIEKYININRFMGYGPQLGTGINFHLPFGLSVVGKMSSSLLFGRAKQGMQTIEDNFLVADSKTRPTWKMIPEAQLSTGLNWGMCFSGTTYLELGASWEGTCFWSVPRNMPQTPGAIIYVNREQTLFLNGLTLSAKIDF